MGIKIKGGHTTITGKGKANIGPSIPMDGLVLYVDPATLLNSTNSGSLVARSPLTSSTFTVTQSSSPTAGDVVALVAGPVNTVIGSKAYPTGAFTPVFYGNAANYTSLQSDNCITGLLIGSNALNLLRQYVKREMTILVWWSGVKISTAYPASGPTPSVGADKSFAMASNNWPPFGDPSSWVDNQTSLGAQTPGFVGHQQTISAANARTYNNLFNNPPFAATGSMITNGFYSASVGTGHFGFTASAPSYTSASAAWPNIPHWYRGIDNNFAGRITYNTNDFWNCTAFIVDRSTNTNATTHSMYMNGALFGTVAGATSSLTTGTAHRGSVSSISNYNLAGTTASFVFGTGTSTLRFIPQTPPGADVYNAGTYTFYFDSGSDTFNTTTRDNLVSKINSAVSSASLYITASAVGSTGLALTGSLPGILYNFPLRFTSSAQPITTLLTLTGGTNSTGTGPLEDIFAIPSINANYYNALSIGIQNTGGQTGSKFRLGTTGVIGGVSIYNRKLSQQEIAQIYDTQKSKYGNIRPSGAPVRPFRIVNPYENGIETPPASSGIIY